MIAVLVVMCAGLSARTAAAGPDADVTKAFTAFVEGVAAGKADPPSLELFLYPTEEDGTKDEALLKAMLSAPKVKVLQVMVSPSGKSAWIAAEIPAKVPVPGKKPRAEVLRATAFFIHDGVGWQIDDRQGLAAERHEFERKSQWLLVDHDDSGDIACL